MPLQLGILCRFEAIVAALLLGLMVGCGESDDPAGVATLGRLPTINKTYGLPPGTRKVAAISLPTPPSIVRIDLSDARIEKIATSKYKAAVKYDFARGFPNPGLVYAMKIHFIDTGLFEMKRCVGSDLKDEGELTWEFELADVSKSGRKFSEPNEFTIHMTEAAVTEGQQEFVSRSNWLTEKVVNLPAE